jgi:protein-L-isoaspartate(D-aspartate) O-methyltransferase
VEGGSRRRGIQFREEADRLVGLLDINADPSLAKKIQRFGVREHLSRRPSADNQPLGKLVENRLQILDDQRVSVLPPPVPHHAMRKDDDVARLLTPVHKHPAELITVDPGHVATSSMSMPNLGWAKPPAASDSPEDLVKALLLEGVEDKRVIEAFRRVRREQFVPPEWTGVAYQDRPIPIPHGQVTTQPSLVGRMVAALKLTGTERVLEVGTGLGFQTAILSLLSGEVFSIERFPDLSEQARSNLRAAGVNNVTLAVGDGTLGLPEHAPFGGILVSAASPEVPPPLVQQLSEGGRVVHPVGSGGDEIVMVFRKEGDARIREEIVVPAHFVRLIGTHGLPEGPP